MILWINLDGPRVMLDSVVELFLCERLVSQPLEV